MYMYCDFATRSVCSADDCVSSSLPLLDPFSITLSRAMSIGRSRQRWTLYQNEQRTTYGTRV